jgi:hypothetical protein
MVREGWWRVPVDYEARLVEAAERLADAVDAAAILAAFDDEGGGPYIALNDDMFVRPDLPGPIRRAAKTFRQALLDYESAKRSR